MEVTSLEEEILVMNKELGQVREHLFNEAGKAIREPQESNS